MASNAFRDRAARLNASSHARMRDSRLAMALSALCVSNSRGRMMLSKRTVRDVQEAGRICAPGRRVMVIDDHVDTAKSLAQLVGMMGYEVQFAVTGHQALAIAGTFHPDIVFMDLKLPDCDGSYLIHWMKAELGLQASRFYAITGYPEEKGRDRAILAGCEDYFEKPVNPDLVETLLDG